uniref:Uncharacterized protein n=1 Tax=Rhizophora mucronata TaxID=61149 RepID=A0A2P2Q0B9_RHIMU
MEMGNDLVSIIDICFKAIGLADRL